MPHRAAQACRSAQAVFVQQGAAGAVFDLDHPEVAVKTALPGDRGIDRGLIPLGQHDPDAVAAGQTEGPLKPFASPSSVASFTTTAPAVASPLAVT